MSGALLLLPPPAPREEDGCEEEEVPMLPVRGAREEVGWRGSSKSLRSAGRWWCGVSFLGCASYRGGGGGHRGSCTIIGIYHVVVLFKGWVVVVVSPDLGRHLVVTCCERSPLSGSRFWLVRSSSLGACCFRISGRRKLGTENCCCW